MVHGRVVMLHGGGEGRCGETNVLSGDGFVFKCSVDSYSDYQMGRLCG